MKFKKMRWFLLSVSVITIATLVGAANTEAKDEKAIPLLGPNYLYIEEFEIGIGQTISEAITKTTEWVKLMRKTGEFKSVRLYMHNTGPKLALYILAEPNNWQSIETGFKKLLDSIPDFMDEPTKFATHSDNLLSEIKVE